MTTDFNKCVAATRDFPVGSRVITRNNSRTATVIRAPEDDRVRNTDKYTYAGSAFYNKTHDGLYIALRFDDLGVIGNQPPENLIRLDALDDMRKALREASERFPVGTRVSRGAPSWGGERREGIIVEAAEYLKQNENFDGYEFDGSAFASKRRFPKGFGGPYIALRMDDSPKQVGNADPDDLIVLSTPLEAVIEPPTINVTVNITITVNPE